jgi:peptidoglycan/LPS O-acetylase OafA/YrhL
MPTGHSSNTLPHGTRIPGVEGVRALAAVSVLVFHCWWYGADGPSRADLGLVNRFVLPHLPLGVTLFFSLSGFLLYQPFVAAALSGSPFPKVGTYFRNRGLRILPAYWAILLAVGVVLPAALLRQSRDHLVLGRLVDAPGLALQTATLTQGYSPGGLLSGIAPAWSLAVEVVFYLTLPLLGLLAVVVARRAARPRWRLLAGLVPAGLLLVVGLSGRAVARFLVPAGGMFPGWDGDWHSVIVRSFWAQADLFAFGMALAVLYVGRHQGLVRLPGRWPLLAVTGAAAAAIPTMLVLDRGVIDKAMYAYQLPMSLACTLLLAVVVLPGQAARPTPLLQVLTSRPLVAVGLASYSLFLWHEPLQRLLHERGLTLDGSGGFAVNLVTLGMLSGLLSALTYRYVERPALRRKRRRQPKAIDRTTGQPLASHGGSSAGTLRARTDPASHPGDSPVRHWSARHR